MKIRKNDIVKIIAGKNKGKTGKVIKVISDKNKIVVDGLNLYKKHVKPKKTGEKGQVVSVPRPFNASNAMVVCQACSKAARVGYKTDGDSKMRICGKCGAKI